MARRGLARRRRKDAITSTSDSESSGDKSRFARDEQRKNRRQQKRKRRNEMKRITPTKSKAEDAHESEDSRRSTRSQTSTTRKQSDSSSSETAKSRKSTPFSIANISVESNPLDNPQPSTSRQAAAAETPTQQRKKRTCHSIDVTDMRRKMIEEIDRINEIQKEISEQRRKSDETNEKLMRELLESQRKLQDTLSDMTDAELEQAEAIEAAQLKAQEDLLRQEAIKLL